MDLGGMVIGAVKDATTRRLIDNGGIPALAQHPQLSPQDTYFNSGVLLIDTDAWRSSEIRKCCESYLSATRDERRFPDQDALNVACYGRWLRLNKRWNHLRTHRLDTYQGNDLSKAVLLHFNSKVKPWHDEFRPGYRKDLYEALARKVRGSGDSL
jgi:UDP-D-galactose:(glucosyl)LPS alpha-1,3-D-galactosyltransferase